MTTNANSLATRIGRAVAVERKRRGWRAADLADALGLSVSRVNHIEQARHNPSRATLDRLVDVLGAEALPSEASDPTPLMTPNWATEGVAGRRGRAAAGHGVYRGASGLHDVAATAADGADNRQRKERTMNDQPIGYEPTPRAARAIALVWIAAGLVVLAARRIHTHRRRVGMALAFAATAFAGWHARGVGPVTVGATRVEAAAPTPTADPLLQPGHYSAPGDDAAVLPPMLQYAAPGGPDDGTPPTWLPAGLAPWWLDIVAAAHENGLDSHAWGAIVAIECPWGDPQCGSQAGAKGLAQIIDGTAATIQAQSGIPCQAQAFDGPTSLRCGAFHFAELLRQNADIWRADDQLPALLAAAVSYNAGPGAQPRRAVRDAAMEGGDLCAGVAFAETASYCQRYRDSWMATLEQRATSKEAMR